MTQGQWNRRDWVKGVGALAAAGAAPLGWAQKPLSVGFIYVGPRDDYGYNQAHAENVALVKKMPGIKVVEEENVPETNAVQKTMQGMIAQDGATLLFPNELLPLELGNPAIPLFNMRFKNGRILFCRTIILAVVIFATPTL